MRSISINNLLLLVRIFLKVVYLGYTLLLDQACILLCIYRSFCMFIVQLHNVFQNSSLIMKDLVLFFYIVERRFNEVLIQMDLPPERAKILKSFTRNKIQNHNLIYSSLVYLNETSDPIGEWK